jgi:hypothetical protein
MPLDDYRRKRKLAETTEPEGRARQSPRRRIFVVQKRDARRLHYDFPTGDQWSAFILGDAQRSLDRSCRAGHTYQGSSARICRIGGRDTGRPIRRWDGDGLGHRHIRPAKQHPTGQAGCLAQDQGSAPRRQAARQLHIDSNPKAFGRSQQKEALTHQEPRRVC